MRNIQDVLSCFQEREKLANEIELSAVIEDRKYNALHSSRASGDVSDFLLFCDQSREDARIAIMIAELFSTPCVSAAFGLT